MKRYDNGELVTEKRMEDESWYPMYQMFLEFVMGEIIRNKIEHVGQLYEGFLDFLKDDQMINYDQMINSPHGEVFKEKILRWSVLQTERFSLQIKDLEWKDNLTEQGKRSGLVNLVADVSDLELSYLITNYKNFEGEIAPNETDAGKLYFQISNFDDDEILPVVVSSLDDAKFLAQYDLEKRVKKMFFKV